MNEQETQIEEAVARTFGRAPGAGSAPVEQFKRAGFCQEDAEQGARLLATGSYLGFEDVASSMRVFDPEMFRRRNPYVTADSIREAASVPASARDRVVNKLIEAVQAGETTLAQSIAHSLKEDS